VEHGLLHHLTCSFDWRIVVANTANPPNEPERRAEEDPGRPPTDISKPIGDAIPAPVEPGLDQPLPKKGENPPPASPAADPLAGDPDSLGVPGDTDTPPGVPRPSGSDFA
jgi:hypothetical protein